MVMALISVASVPKTTLVIIWVVSDEDVEFIACACLMREGYQENVMEGFQSVSENNLDYT